MICAVYLCAISTGVYLVLVQYNFKILSASIPLCAGGIHYCSFCRPLLSKSNFIAMHPLMSLSEITPTSRLSSSTMSLFLLVLSMIGKACMASVDGATALSAEQSAPHVAAVRKNFL